MVGVGVLSYGGSGGLLSYGGSGGGCCPIWRTGERHNVNRSSMNADCWVYIPCLLSVSCCRM